MEKKISFDYRLAWNRQIRNIKDDRRSTRKNENVFHSVNYARFAYYIGLTAK